MSKKENKRFKDSERKTAPKRGGKNRRDYGDNYEPRRKSEARGSRSYGQSEDANDAYGRRKDVRGGRSRSYGDNRNAGGRTNSSRTDGRRRSVLGFDMNEPYENEALIGSDGLEVIAGRNPVTEALNGEREVERIFIADGSEGSVSRIVAIAREQGVIVDFVPKERIDAMAPGAKHQGVVAKVSEYKYAEMEDVFAGAEKAGE